ncbi:hypothetical protein GcC1_192019 [Golovinomyces cichoracearum]|uniref:Uncharacterized protein n=1 Tax=Golovinomyces cichoracearum TaxID=62708 RepID=A0A420HHY3_9PEZI|nr:hypothetical protein GcC1_192019 [Golovinomyces cichoracearum]
MEENSSNGRENEKRQRGRFMGKLFKEPKKPTSEMEVDDFLHGPSDKNLTVPTHPPNPQSFTRVDPSLAHKTPIEFDIDNSRKAKESPAKPKQARKSLIVRFSDSAPEIIGEGGDIAETPTIDISLRKRARLGLPSQSLKVHSSTDEKDLTDYANKASQRPGSMGDLITDGFPKIKSESDDNVEGQNAVAEETDQTSHTKLDKTFRNHSAPGKERDKYSFSQRVRDEMRSGEGMTLVASRNSIDGGNLSRSLAIDGTSSQLEELHLNTISNAIRSESPRPTILNEPQNEDFVDNSITISKFSTAIEYPSPARQVYHSYVDVSSKQIIGPNLETYVSTEDEAFTEFSNRTAHLSRLFHLSTEAVKPIGSCSTNLLIRTGIWWFLKGRKNLEAAAKDRTTGSQTQTTHFSLNQAYMDLAKSSWVLEIVASRSTGTELNYVSESASTDALDAQKSVTCSMKKLATSMKRNNFFPSSSCEFPQIQGLNSEFWAQEDGDKSLLVGQRLLSSPSLLGSLPLGDTAHIFHFGIIFAEAVLTEEGAPQKFRCPVVLSIIRKKKEESIQVIVTNQDGSLTFAIQCDKNKGPAWTDLKWYIRKSIIEVRLPRGFFLSIHCSEIDFGMIWKIFDYEKRTYGILSQRPGEQFVFKTTLKNLQYLDGIPHPTFSKDPQPHCHMRLYERILSVKAASGPRMMHRGFRIAIVTSQSIKNLGGIDLDLLPSFPIEFSFLRGEGGLPAILLKTGGTASRRVLIATFNELKERTQFHAILSGFALGPEEEVIARGYVKAFTLGQMSEKSISLLQALDWQSFKFINQRSVGLQGCKTVLSEKLRIILEFRYGTMTDRINVGPGELKFRLDPRRPHQLQILRQPQVDLTTMIESQAPKGSPQGLEEILTIAKGCESIRAYTFPSINELHLFQLALTGFEVLFDEVVTSLNISRRRMVVPIYKKWDATMPRVQVVKKEKVTQLVVFFENFSHGDCMSFVLRSTDIFESSVRSGKNSLRIVDAKFALPKSKTESTGLENEFVCLDMPEYPGEHDDISIHFDNKKALESFIVSMPSPVKHVSRMGTVRK